MKRLFRVELSTAVYVVAESDTDAEKYAKEIMAGDDSVGVEFDTFSRPVHSKFPVEPEWLEAFPYGDISTDEDLTVTQWLKRLQAEA